MVPAIRKPILNSWFGNTALVFSFVIHTIDPSHTRRTEVVAPGDSDEESTLFPLDRLHGRIWLPTRVPQDSPQLFRDEPCSISGLVPGEAVPVFRPHRRTSIRRQHVEFDDQIHRP